MFRFLLNLLDFRGRRRRRVAARRFPLDWSDLLEKNIGIYRELSREEQDELHRRILIFLDEKTFEGVGGLEMTDEIRITIAAQACLLLLGRATDYYPTLSSIIVYPSAYVAPSKQQLPDGTMIEGPQARRGESWHRGNVVLSWDDVLRGAADAEDGHNVVLHEFAHQLDGEYGGMEGAPLLANRSMYTAWAKVLGAEYEELVERVYRGRPSAIDAYGATNPAEFFAVVTELFFERPRELRAEHPELYEQLRGFYRQDPAARSRR